MALNDNDDDQKISGHDVVDGENEDGTYWRERISERLHHQGSWGFQLQLHFGLEGLPPEPHNDGYNYDDDDDEGDEDVCFLTSIAIGCSDTLDQGPAGVGALAENIFHLTLVMILSDYDNIVWFDFMWRYWITMITSSDFADIIRL